MKTVRLIQRRSILVGSALTGAGLIARPWRSFATEASSSVAHTTAGDIRGTFHQGVHAFKGVPYGASTAGPNRLRPPQKPAPWRGVRDTLSYGPMAPQIVPPRPQKKDDSARASVSVFTGGMNPWAHDMSEDCLVLNVWTAGLRDGRTRPVMLWCHGGGFGGGIGAGEWFDGTKLARKHDVVLVNSNHRLNVLGYLYLAELGGERYADSGNVGMLDIVAALEWIRDNIAEFGGDPGNVTIFGESGGGAKVSTLMAMPKAQGLFHRAIVQSYSHLRANTPEDAAYLTRGILKALDLTPNQLDRLQTLPLTTLLGALNHVSPNQPRQKIRFGPVVDGRSLLRHPFDPDAPAVSAQVPMLIGSTKDDSRGILSGLTIQDWAQVEAELQTRYDVPKDRTAQLVEAFRATRPKFSPQDVFMDLATELHIRRDAIRQAERKSAQGAAPAYMYLFAWEGPDPQYRAFHQVEIPFAFDNLDKAPGLRGAMPDQQMQALADQTSKAWVAFARTGNPNHSGLPEWKPYTVKNRATMVFDSPCKLIDDPRREERLAVSAAT